jgi:hypothetical protein
MDFQLLGEAVGGGSTGAKMCCSVPGSKIDRRPRALPQGTVSATHTAGAARLDH